MVKKKIPTNLFPVSKLLGGPLDLQYDFGEMRWTIEVNKLVTVVIIIIIVGTKIELD